MSSYVPRLPAAGFGVSRFPLAERVNADAAEAELAASQRLGSRWVGRLYGVAEVPEPETAGERQERVRRWRGWSGHR